MITNRLKNLFLLAILFFIVHGLEEIFSGFANTDSHAAFIFGKLTTLPTMEALFILFQIMIWLLLVIGYLLLLGPKWQLRLLSIPAIIFIYELHHLYKALAVGGYYPGLATAIPLYVIGFFFWNELIKNYKLIK